MGPGDARAETPRPLRDPTLAVSRPRWLRYGTAVASKPSCRACVVRGDRMGRYLLVWPFPLGLASIRNDFDAGPCAHTRPAAPLVRCASRGG